MESRFGIEEFHLTYDFDNPTHSVSYTEEEKEAQRKAGAALKEEIQAAIDSGETSYTATPGFYRFADGGIGFRNAENFTLNIAYCDFVIETGKFLGIYSSRNITVKGPCTVDSADLKYIHGRIESVEDGLAIVYVPEGYDIDGLSQNNHRLIFDSQGYGLEQHQATYSDPKSIGDRRVEVRLGSGKAVQVGNIVVMKKSGGAASTLSIRDSDGVYIDGIDSYVGGGWDAKSGSKNLTFKNIRLRPAPGTNRIFGGSAGQFLVPDGDVLFDGCEFGAHTDDGINLYLPFHITYKQTAPQEVLIAGRSDLKVGNTLSFRDYFTGEEQTAVISKVEKASSEITDQIKSDFWDEVGNSRSGAIQQSYHVQLESPVQVNPWAWAFTVGGPGSGPDSFTVRNCYFHDASAEPITMKAAKQTLIENCVFIRNRDEFHAGAHFYWWEGPPANNVTVRNSVFIATPMKLQDVGVLRFSLPGWGGLQDGATAMENITVENNSFYGINAPAVQASHVDNVVIRNNYIELSEIYFNGGSRQTKNRYALILDSISNGLVTGNVIKMLDPIRQGPAILAEHTTSTEISENQISHIGSVEPYFYEVTSERGGHEALNMLDGDLSTSWSFSNGYPQHAILDLTKTEQIEGTDFYFASNRDYTYTVEVSDSPDSGYQMVVDRRYNYDSAEVITDTFSPVSGRFVKITIMRGNSYTGSWFYCKEFNLHIVPDSDVTSPEAPSNLNAGTADGLVHLDWAENSESDLDYYRIYRSEFEDSGYELIGQTQPSFYMGSSPNFYTDETANTGTPFYYRVSAIDLYGNESPMSPAFAVTAEATLGELTIASDLVGGQQSHKPSEDSYDDEDSTRWANLGTLESAWIRYDLGESQKVQKLSLLPYLGKNRSYPLKISVGTLEVFNGNTEKGKGYLDIPIPPKEGRYVTIEMTGKNSFGSEWLSLHEVEVHGVTEAPDEEPKEPIASINVGGETADSFDADYGFSGGLTARFYETIDTSGVSNPAPEAVYQSERYGNFDYTIRGLEPDTLYTVRLHFAETYWDSVGARIFDIVIHGTTVLENYDVFAEAGGKNIAIVEEFSALSDSSGEILLSAQTKVDNAKISGIEVK
ncbi:discoidin domain-containing protein [Coraliomargarita sinensis]|nr:discoidin domain-containing protein [Coraliomargarita sinensis]